MLRVSMLMLALCLPLEATAQEPGEKKGTAQSLCVYASLNYSENAQLCASTNVRLRCNKEGKWDATEATCLSTNPVYPPQ